MSIFCCWHFTVSPNFFGLVGLIKLTSVHFFIWHFSCPESSTPQTSTKQYSNKKCKCKCELTQSICPNILTDQAHPLWHRHILMTSLPQQASTCCQMSLRKKTSGLKIPNTQIWLSYRGRAGHGCRRSVVLAWGGSLCLLWVKGHLCQYQGLGLFQWNNILKPWSVLFTSSVSCFSVRPETCTLWFNLHSVLLVSAAFPWSILLQ